MKSNIPVVFITDNNYTLPTGVAICSLVKNYMQNHILEIYIIYSELTEKNRECLMASGNDQVIIKLIHFDASDYVQYKNKSIYVTPTSLIKFQLANILKDYSKALYLDGDIIVRGDISKLLEVDLHDNYCAAVQDFESCTNYLSCERLKLSKYFNSGVMVLNLEKIREDNLSKKMFDIKNNRKDLYYMDQDVLNLAFDGRIVELSVKYNCILNSFRENISINEINEFFKTEFVNYQSFMEEVIVIHLAGGNKPWRSKQGTCYREWIEYYNESTMTDIELGNEVAKNKKVSPLIKKRYINKKGLLQTDYYFIGICLVSKIRTEKGIKYYIGKK